MKQMKDERQTEIKSGFNSDKLNSNLNSIILLVIYLYFYFYVI